VAPCFQILIILREDLGQVVCAALFLKFLFTEKAGFAQDVPITGAVNAGISARETIEVASAVHAIFLIPAHNLLLSFSNESGSSDFFVFLIVPPCNQRIFIGLVPKLLRGDLQSFFLSVGFDGDVPLTSHHAIFAHRLSPFGSATKKPQQDSLIPLRLTYPAHSSRQAWTSKLCVKEVRV
jgi:hypothetical protein